ncbi:MAG: tetratricopeptide repeat protein, partial [Chloroflexia bacterium]
LGDVMEVQFQQNFDSPSAELGVLATNPSSGLFSGYSPVSDSEEAEIYYSTILDLEEIVVRLKQGDHLTPNDVVAAFDLGVAYKMLGRWAESAEAFTMTLEFSDKIDDEHRKRNLAMTYYMRDYAYSIH